MLQIVKAFFTLVQRFKRLDRGARFVPNWTVRSIQLEADFGEKAEGVSDRLLYSYRHKLYPSAACNPVFDTIAWSCLFVGHGTHTSNQAPSSCQKNMAEIEEGGDDRRIKE